MNIDSKTHRVTSVKNQSNIMQIFFANYSRNTMFYAIIAIKDAFSMHQGLSDPLGSVENLDLGARFSTTPSGPGEH